MEGLIIYNPKAGYKKYQVLLEPFLEAHFPVIETLRAGHATEIVKENFSDYTLFIAAGGDGTVNEVAKALVGTSKLLGILPMGSGNGFVNEVGKITLKSLVESSYTIKAIDTLFLNEHPFFNVAGIGFEALIAREFHGRKNRGLFSYLWLTLSKFIKFNPVEVCYSVNRTFHSHNIFTLTIANSKQYGNNVIISPQSRSDDGIFEVCIIKSFPRIYGPILGIRLFNGSVSKSKYYQVRQSTAFELSGENTTLWNLDGESIEIEGKVRVSINPGSLKILTDR